MGFRPDRAVPKESVRFGTLRCCSTVTWMAIFSAFTSKLGASHGLLVGYTCDHNRFAGWSELLLERRPLMSLAKRVAFCPA
jgi:hypothetical protein